MGISASEALPSEADRATPVPKMRYPDTGPPRRSEAEIGRRAAGAEDGRVFREFVGRNLATGQRMRNATPKVFLTLIQPDGTFKPVDKR